ncbi:MAG: DHA2 family efflux MFS transporter permease subunit [Acidimicrobiales bacterium]
MSVTERPGSTAGTGPRRRLGLALAVISTAQLMVVLDATIVNIALPSIRRDLHFSLPNLEWVITAYALTFGGLLLFGGRTGDLFGRRRMFMVGIGIFAVSSLLGGFATSQAWLIAARAAQGVGGAIASPTALSLIATTFPEGSARDRAMGVYAAMSGAGGAIGLLVGGILTDVASWRWVLFVNVPIGALVLLVAPRVLAESGTRAGKLDLPGALSVTGGMALLVYGLTHAASHSWGATGTVVPLAIAVALLVAFVGIEMTSRQPLMPLRIFANRDRSGAYAIMLTVGAALFAVFFFLTQFVQNILGFSPLVAGVAFLPLTFVIAGTAISTSRLVTRTGPRLPMTVGPLLAAGGLFWLSRLTAGSGYLAVLGPMVVLAVGMGLAFVPLTLTAVAGVRQQETGLASALLNTGQQIGGALGLAVLGTIAAATIKSQVRHLAASSHGHLTHHLVNVATATGYAHAFLVAAAIALGAFVIAVVAIRVKAGARPQLAGAGAAGVRGERPVTSDLGVDEEQPLVTADLGGGEKQSPVTADLGGSEGQPPVTTEIGGRG